MKSKGIVILAGLPAILLFFGLLIVRAEEQALPESGDARTTESSYQIQVKAAQNAFAAERASLDLANTAGAASTPEADLGDPRCSNAAGGSGGSGSGASAARAATCASCDESSKGAPVWRVNMVNLNLYMTDTPLWYDSPVGPALELKLSYNSLTGLGGPLGNKWQLNYASYLYPAVDNAGLPAGIMIVMPDGRQQLYLTGGSGAYISPYQAYNTLSKVAENRFELKFTDGKVLVYDLPAGTTAGVSRLVEVRDAYGQKLTMGYNAEARLTTITDALGKATTLSYNQDGLLVQAADPFGRTASFLYDGNNNLTKITDMGGYWTSFTYRHAVLTDYYLASLANGEGSWAFSFEPADGLDNGGDPYPAPGTAMGANSRITVTNPGGDSEEFYRSGASAWYIDPEHYLAYAGPSNNNYASNVPRTIYDYVVTAEKKGEVGSITTPEGNTTNFGYEDVNGTENTGNITGLSQGLSSLSYSYNGMGKITSITDAQNAVTNFSYAANGVDLTGITNGLGTTALTYNGAHDISSFTDQAGHTRSTAYNVYGQITSTTDQLGTVTSYIYNAGHLLARITRKGETLRSFTYDSRGRVRTSIDDTGLTLTYSYNNLNDITKITYPDGTAMTIGYSSTVPHLITSLTDRGGKTSRYSYTAAKNITEILNAAGGTTGFDRDRNGNLVQLVDPAGRRTDFAFDLDNRLSAKTFADGTAISYTHDAANRLTSRTGARNLSTSYTFNANGTLWGISHTPNLAYPTSPAYFQYDTYQRLTTVIDGTGTTGYGYGADSLVTSIDGPLANDTLTLQYDAKGRKTRYSLQRGQTVSYTYDAFDRLTSVQGGGGSFSYTYSGASPLVQRLTRPNGSYTEYQYDASNRLTMLANKTSSGTIINRYAYTYNAQGLRLSEEITNGVAVTSLTKGKTSYNYNTVNALLSTTNPARTFAYDADGNLTEWQSPAGKPLTAVYDIENRLKSAGYEIMTQTPVIDFESLSVNYEYTSDGIVAKKEVEYSRYSTGEYSSKTTNYVRHGLLLLQERDENDAILREYTWGAHYGGGIGGLLALKQAGQNYFYLYDGKGNVTAVIDSSQAVVAAYSYDAFGNLLAKAGSLDQPFQFSTKPYDETTGLSNFGYRFYAPASGRWSSRDPLGEKAGLNLYQFVKCDPVNRVDADGLDSCGPGEVELETRIDNGDDPPTKGHICAPEKSLWEKIEDWLLSLQTHGEPGMDRALAHQCRITAGE